MSPIKLTPRQFEILELICQGYRNREIANKLYIVENTVECQINHIYNKFGASHIRELIYLAYKYGVVSPPNSKDYLKQLISTLNELVENLINIEVKNA